MNNTLIDNSIEALSMTTTLRKCLAIDGIKTVSIATGYWDIPGLAILQENLRSFIEKEGTTLRLLIGKDPYIYVNQLKSPKYKDANYPLVWRANLCATFLGNLVYPTQASKMLHFP